MDILKVSDIPEKLQNTSSMQN